MRQVFKDRDGRRLGWSERAGTRTTGYDADGRIVGWYEIGRNEIRDRDGRLFGNGDLLAALITSSR